MKTTTVMILAAMGAAALASPVMAQTATAQGWRSSNVPVSENNALWGVETAPPQEHVYGSAARPRAGRFAPDAAAHPPRVLDCVHVQFPQCSGS